MIFRKNFVEKISSKTTDKRISGKSDLSFFFRLQPYNSFSSFVASSYQKQPENVITSGEKEVQADVTFSDCFLADVLKVKPWKVGERKKKGKRINKAESWLA